MVTIREISKLSGYAISTVSHALNGRGRVSEKTRQKIIAIARQVNYIPNNKAISLSIGKSHTLGIIVPYTEANAYYDRLINAIIAECFACNYRPTFLATHYNQAIEDGYLRLLASKEFDGIIITSASNAYTYIEKYLPYGNIVSCEHTGNSRVPFVTLDRKQGYSNVIQHFQKKGIRKFGCTFSRTPTSSLGSKFVYSIFKEYVAHFSEKYAFSNTKDYQDGVRAANYFMQKIPDIECIFANSDEIAAGIIHRYQETKFSTIPIVIGQNNEPWSIALEFPTIDFQIHQLGTHCVQNIVGQTKKNSYVKSIFYERGI